MQHEAVSVLSESTPVAQGSTPRRGDHIDDRQRARLPAPVSASAAWEPGEGRLAAPGAAASSGQTTGGPEGEASFFRLVCGQSKLFPD